MEQKLLTPGPLLDENGDLVEAGYANSLVKTYDRKAIKAGKYRIKEWDYYYIGNADYGLALTIADNSYMSLVSASVLTFKAPCFERTASDMAWFTKGKLGLPSTSKEGDLVYENKKKGISFAFKHENGKRRLIGTWDKFGKNGEQLRFDVTLEETSPNSMVIATPFKKKKHFYYNQKINCLKANGYFKFGEEIFDLGKCYGVLDWGRGVWTYKNTWYWSSLNSTLEGKPFGWNLGYGFGDTSNASENMVFYGDKVYKLDDVRFDIPLNAEGKDDFMAPWTFRSLGGDIRIDFEPVYNRHADTNALIIRSNQNQVFGLFKGYFLLDGQEVYFEDLPGFAEKVYNKW